MKHLVLCSLLIVFMSSAMGLSSYTDSGLVSLDTVPPQIDLISPNGGEAWYIGDTRDIIWTASDPNLDVNSVYLWYSLNGGMEYLSLEEAIAHNGSYAWELPSVQSYNARVRVGLSDGFGNQFQRSSANSFSITYVPPDTVRALTINASNNLDVLLTWQAVTQSIPPYNSPITPDGYIVLYNESPHEHNAHFYYFLGRSFTTNYTHHDVLEFRNQMFYRVLAYKNYTREESEAFENLLLKRGDKPLLWQDALQTIRQGGK